MGPENQRGRNYGEPREHNKGVFASHDIVPVSRYIREAQLIH